LLKGPELQRLSVTVEVLRVGVMIVGVISVGVMTVGVMNQALLFLKLFSAAQQNIFYKRKYYFM
jgi:hypothetical protein